MRKTLVAGLAGALAAGMIVTGCGAGSSLSASGTATPPNATPGATAPPASPASTTPPSTSAPIAATTVAPTTAAPTTATTLPCALSTTPGSANTIPVQEVCSAAGAPHFATPAAAMTYLAAAWNSDDVQRLDYVTNPAGRAQMDAMAAQMVDLQFGRCSPNPAGDYTCYFRHNIDPSTSPTTYPNPLGFPPGEAVFTVAPADGPGWYLTNVIHCG